MSSLPKGWKNVLLNAVVDKIVGGGTPSKSIPSYFEGDIPWMTVKDMNKTYLTDTVDHITQEAVENSSTNIIPADTPIIATRMSLGKIVRASFDSAINQDLKALFVNEEVDKYYFELWYRSQGMKIESLGTGTTVKGVRLEVINALVFPLAPLAEQKRIVEKLDEVLAQVDTIKARLDGIPSLLKRFRQSVLASAVSGKLTEEWRGERTQMVNGYIDEYLDYIRTSRKEAFERLYSNEKRKRKYVDPDGCLEVKFNELPSSWKLVSLSALTYRITYGLTVRPKYAEQGTPIISAKEIRNGYVDYESAKRFDSADFSKQREKCKIYLNDVLFSKTGSIGHVALVQKDIEMCSSQNIAVLSPLIEPSYLELVMRSNYIQNLAKNNVKANAIPDLQLGIMSKFPIPVCIREEQKEIVRLVNQYFAFADTIEAQVKKAQARVNNLTQSILAKAFRGELVPQDPNDEPADKLLERIAQARIEAETLAKATKKAETARKKAAKSA